MYGTGPTGSGRSPAKPDTLRRLLSEHDIKPSNHQEHIEGHKFYQSVLETRAMARAVWCYLFNYIKTESLNNVIMMRSIVPFDKLTELICSVVIL